MLKVKNIIKEMKNAFNRLINKFDRAKKESINSKTFQQKLPKLKQFK
jgi:hypothetical protein